MRELTNEELFLVAGAAAAADVDPSEPPTEIPPIVVNPPTSPPPSPPPTIPPSPPVEQPGPITPPGGGGGAPTPPPPLVSGLGAGADAYLNKSDEVKSLLSKYIAGGADVEFKDLGTVKGEVEAGNIYLDDDLKGTSLQAATVLTHELYHVYNPVNYGTTTPTQEQYVNAWLNNEAGSVMFEMNFVKQVEATSITQYPADLTSIYNQIGTTLTTEQATAKIAEWYGNQDHGGGQTVKQYYESVYNSNKK
ncbi:hypothetical protein [Xanthomonas campestris]|uniref:hypothetical protein n=1 Tax=Xanthomonas campestris TaxID=339 RepID=UPI001E506028|nr:hypothetical protein [Xanthomonas campestris]MCC5074697.1 hypothetical protein [Xanthomonas campestris pv. plantaginis]